jgi:argininosuccinate lyase
MKIKRTSCAGCRTGFSNATDVADYLVRTGMPFREAHEVVGKSVRYCIEHGKNWKSSPGRMEGFPI